MPCFFSLIDGLSLGHPKCKICGNGLCTTTLVGMQPKQDRKKESESRKETLMWKCPVEPACTWNPVGLISYRLIFRETALQDSVSGLRREKNWLVSHLSLVNGLLWGVLIPLHSCLWHEPAPGQASWACDQWSHSWSQTRAHSWDLKLCRHCLESLTNFISELVFYKEVWGTTQPALRGLRPLLTVGSSFPCLPEMGSQRPTLCRLVLGGALATRKGPHSPGEHLSARGSAAWSSRSNIPWQVKRETLEGRKKLLSCLLNKWLHIFILYCKFCSGPCGAWSGSVCTVPWCW